MAYPLNSQVPQTYGTKYIEDKNTKTSRMYSGKYRKRNRIVNKGYVITMQHALIDASELALIDADYQASENSSTTVVIPEPGGDVTFTAVYDTFEWHNSEGTTFTAKSVLRGQMV